MTAHKISDHMQEFRTPAGMASDEYFTRDMKVSGSPTESIGEEFIHFRKPFQALTRYEWSNRREGAWEFRIKARVGGRMTELEPLVVKTVQGAIRVAWWDNKAFTADRLQFSSQRKP